METKEVTTEDWIKLLLDTAHREWGSVERWSHGICDFNPCGCCNEELEQKLPQMISILKNAEQKYSRQ